MRIVGGAQRGVKLAEVGAGDTAAHLRPTSDRVRESLFNVLAGGRFGDPVTGARVLDLFAGTGALGLEALSRGAAHASFVDSGSTALSLIAANIAKLRREGNTTVLPVEVDAIPPGRPCSLIFLDPPYGQRLGAAALAWARAQGWIAPGALIVWEENAPQIAPPGYARRDTRAFGETHLTFLEAL
ncbi:16S rRNA (guanine(966)-N(2))-methyltransferase RsmD [Salipiger sp. IMCC34102]|uniref:16S rRNA (guanine(966)-N(2))-methyltransferase RsmD n=1 Tax=Salipiger sp. IMCC34102 TaxID=2510647 RepID=UPI00101DFFC9|nr:16S rRNA (guanine(966)-N(2))-methyltransferase RsmD [Salipiger sp. IMCC34102]RYH01961.1 16S rRNA (guanine(966)-N(2))-methyltransferase RsmD [Salipiger sp. IMCC34102]